MVCSRETRIFAAQQHKQRMERERYRQNVRFVLGILIVALAFLLAVGGV